MIEKWYCIKCDNCEEVINYWLRSSVKKAYEAEKELDGDLTTHIGGHDFCSKECYEKWRRENA